MWIGVSYPVVDLRFHSYIVIYPSWPNLYKHELALEKLWRSAPADIIDILFFVPSDLFWSYLRVLQAASFLIFKKFFFFGVGGVI